MHPIAIRPTHTVGTINVSAHMVANPARNMIAWAVMICRAILLASLFLTSKTVIHPPNNNSSDRLMLNDVRILDMLGRKPAPMSIL